MPGIGILGEPGMDLLAAALAAPLACWRGWASPRVAWIAAGAAFITSLVLLACASPAFDDYAFANSGHSGWWAFQGEIYRTWSGRFLANGVLSGWPLLLPFDAGYPFVVIAIWSGTVAAMAWLAWLVLPAAWPAGSRAAVLAWLAIGWLAGLPDFADGVAWAAGSINYMLPAGLLAVGCALLLRGGRWRTTAAMPCLALSCGACEHMLVIAVVLVGGGCLWRWCQGARDRTSWTVALLVVMAASVLSVAAPGHAERRKVTFQDGREPPGVAGAILLGIGGSTSQVSRAGGHVATLAALLLAAGIAASAARAGRKGAHGAWPLATLALAPLVHVAIELPILYGQGIGAPGRGLDLIWTGVWACLGLVAITGGMWWSDSGRMVQGLRLSCSMLTRRRARMLAALLLMMMVTLLLLVCDRIAVATAIGLMMLLVGCWLAALRLTGPCRQRREAAAALGQRALAVACLSGALIWGTWSQLLADLPLLPAHMQALSARHAALADAGPGDLVRLPIWDPERTPRSIVAYDMTAGRADNASQASWYGVGGIIVGPFARPLVGPLPAVP